MALSYDVLKNADFRRLLATRVLGIFALQAQAVIVGWQVYTLTHDPLMLGLIGLTEAVPAILMSLFSGYIVDSNRPHRIFLISLSGLALLALVLLIVAGGLVSLGRDHVLAVIFGAVFLSGLARSFIMPASFTLLPQIVPRHDIPAASAWLSSGFQLAAITGPAIAGIVYGVYGAAAAWCIPFAMLACACLALARISRPVRGYMGQQRGEKALASITAGWRFVLGSRVLLPIMALDMFAVLFGGVVAILPVFADQILHTGSEGLGLLRAAPAIGSIVTALYCALKPMQTIRATTLLIVITGFGFTMLGFGLSTTLVPALVFLALSGAFDSVSMVMRGTLMQLLIPEEMRGRVSALNSMFIISSNEIGAFRAGSMASVLGLVPSILTGGVMTLGVVAFTALRCPELRRLVIHTGDKEEKPA